VGTLSIEQAFQAVSAHGINISRATLDNWDFFYVFAANGAEFMEGLTYRYDSSAEKFICPLTRSDVLLMAQDLKELDL